MSGLMVYLVTRLDTICEMVEILSVTSGLFLVGLLFWYFAEGMEALTAELNSNIPEKSSRINNVRSRWLRWRNSVVTIFAISVSGVAFIPTTKEAAAIIITPKVLTNTRIEQFGEFGDNLTTLATQWSRKIIGNNPSTTTESSTENK